MTENSQKPHVRPSRLDVSGAKEEHGENADVGYDPAKQSLGILAFDVIPALVILVNALIIGLSSDINSGDFVWEVFEFVFLVFFTGELIANMSIFGVRTCCMGPNAAWNMFDAFCLMTAYFDMLSRYVFTFKGGGLNPNMLKMIRLVRLTRVIRLLRFKIFVELKLILAGVLSGVRVMFWSIVLLAFLIYLLAVVMKTVTDGMFLEFESIPASMFTLFRCFTEGCTSYDGTPLQERLRIQYGGVFMIAYMLVTIFITIGLFNLIMAIFIENVASAQLAKRQCEIGLTTKQTEALIRRTIAALICNVHSVDGTVELKKHDGTTELVANNEEDVLEFMSHNEVEVTRAAFNAWVRHPVMQSMFEQAYIDTATKHELFDVLDGDMNGYLTVAELVGGLMRLRGPVSKSDVVAVRLKVRNITRFLDKHYGYLSSCGNVAPS